MKRKQTDSTLARRTENTKVYLYLRILYLLRNINLNTVNKIYWDQQQRWK